MRHTAFNTADVDVWKGIAHVETRTEKDSSKIANNVYDKERGAAGRVHRQIATLVVPSNGVYCGSFDKQVIHGSRTTKLV